MNHAPGTGPLPVSDAGAILRERAVVEALVAAANALASGYDEVELLQDLTTTCADLLDVESAGLLLADTAGELRLMAASSEDLRLVELYQLQQEEGPCIDCFRSGEPVQEHELGTAHARWPRFVPGALAAGFASVHAVPMRVPGTRLGALGLFGSASGTLGGDDVRIAQALADVASSSIVQSKAAVDQGTVIAQLQGALDSRIVLEQAKGILAQHAGVGMPEAFGLLRLWARNHNERIRDVAARLTQRSLTPGELVEHARLRHDGV